MTQDPAQLLAQADKAYSSASSSFSFFGSKIEKLENAANLYKNAAIAYKRNAGGNQKDEDITPERKEAGRQAGMAFEKAATIQGAKLGETDEMAHTLHDASKVYQPGSPEDAARCLSQVVDHWLSKGEFRRAAQYMQTLAETYESMGDISKARPAYEAAAQWFEDERSSAIGNRLSLKAADLAALDGEYLAAIKRFEYAAKQTDPTNATRFFTTDYLFRAGVCHLALDLIGAKRALDNYRGPYPTFPPTDQFQLLADLLELAEQGDSEAFGLKVYRYEKLHTLNPWFKTIFNRIDAQLREKEEDFS